MFYYKKDLTRRIRLHPKYIGAGKSVTAVVRKLAKQEISNSFTIEHGYVVSVVAISKVGPGFCIPLSGMVEHAVNYEAIVMYPIVGEIIYAEVVAVTETCISFRHIFVYGVVRSYAFGDIPYEYLEKETFTVKKELIPESAAEDPKANQSATEGYFRSKIDCNKVIQKGTVIRLRIIQRTIGGNGFFLIGSMDNEHLGPLTMK